jgi:hypothetical protein
MCFGSTVNAKVHDIVERDVRHYDARAMSYAITNAPASFRSGNMEALAEPTDKLRAILDV